MLMHEPVFFYSWDCIPNMKLGNKCILQQRLTFFFYFLYMNISGTVEENIRQSWAWVPVYKAPLSITQLEVQRRYLASVLC